MFRDQSNNIWNKLNECFFLTHHNWKTYFKIAGYFIDNNNIAPYFNPVEGGVLLCWREFFSDVHCSLCLPRVVSFPTTIESGLTLMAISLCVCVFRNRQDKK